MCHQTYDLDVGAGSIIAAGGRHKAGIDSDVVITDGFDRQTAVLGYLNPGSWQYLYLIMEPAPEDSDAGVLVDATLKYRRRP